LANFPSDLNIFIDKGYLISSYNRPYFFWLRDEKERLKLVFVIDESASEEKINQYPTKALLTKTDLLIKGAGKVKKIPLSSFNQIVFNKETLKIIRQRLFFIEKFFYIFYFFIFLFIFVFTFLFSFLINLFYLFIASLLVLGLPIKLPPFPLLFLFLLIIFVIVGVYEAYYNNHHRKNLN
jgi:hypothetical protein